LCVYRGGKVLHQFFTEYRLEQFRATSDGQSVEIGPNTLQSVQSPGVAASLLAHSNANPDASKLAATREIRVPSSYDLTLQGTPWTLTGRGPVTHFDQTLSASLRVDPVRAIEPVERTFLSKEMTGATHRWTIAAPMCRASGSIDLKKADGTPIETIAFN